MITIQHTQESLSRAYAQAVAAKAGVNIRLTSEHDYGIDGTFHLMRTIKSRHVEAGFPLDFQLKASTTCEFQKEALAYDFEVKNYNDLVQRRSVTGTTPCILVLLCLPESQDDWLDLDEERLQLRKCCYWMHIDGTVSDHKQSVRIHIPRKQLFSPEALQDLLRQFRAGELS